MNDWPYPEEWHNRELSDVVNLNPESLDSDTPSDFQFQYIDIASVSEGIIDWNSVTRQVFRSSPSRARRVVRPFDILLSTVRPNLKSHTFADWPDEDGYVCSTGFAILRAKNNLVPRFLYHLIFHEIVARQLHRLEIGSNYPAVNESDVKQLKISLPRTEEQRLIAAILDTVDNAIHYTEQLIVKLKQVRAGLLHDLLTYGIDENGDLREPVQHPQQFKESELGLIPIEWEILQVGELFDLQLGKMMSKRAKIGNHAFPYLANRNVLWDRVDVSDLEWMDFTQEEQHKFSLIPGDLLICEGGEIGRTALWNGELDNCYYQKAIHRLRRKNARILPSFMQRFMRYAVVNGLLTNLSSQTSIMHLTQEKLVTLQMFVPDPYEQYRITTILDQQDEEIQTEQVNLSKLRLLKQGVTDDLLTGRVRVTSSIDNVD